MHIHVASLTKKILTPRKRVIVLKKYSQQQLKNAILNAKASLEIEGLFLTHEEEQLLLERAEGKMSHSEFLARAKEIADNV